jgi:SAM-dependent methyltransferase
MKSLVKRVLYEIDLIVSRVAIKVAILLNRLSVFDFYQAIPELKVEMTTASEHVSLIKWDAVRNSLPADYNCSSVLDLGCNTGLYSIKMAKLGHMVTAIDGLWYYKEFCFYACKVLGLNNVAVGQMKITPENIDCLPQYDCIFFLNIFHHLCKEHGKDTALAMLDKIYKKATRLLFFETEQSDSSSGQYKEVLPDMGESPKEWMIELFNSKGAREVKELSYNNGRHLMVIYKT